ncbi:MAG: PilZ domain-containing protein, partial [Planctomycetota bacterium]
MERSAGVATDLVKQIQGWTSLGTASEVVEKILEEQFAGRRDALRTFKFLDLAVQGTGGTFKAMGINISRTGLLFRITDPRFADDGEQQHLMPYTARVWQNFTGGFHVFLESGAISREADIVRVSGYCGRKSSLVLVGCRFRSELLTPEC